MITRCSETRHTRKCPLTRAVRPRPGQVSFLSIDKDSVNDSYCVLQLIWTHNSRFRFYRPNVVISVPRYTLKNRTAKLVQGRRLRRATASESRHPWAPYRAKRSSIGSKTSYCSRKCLASLLEKRRASNLGRPKKCYFQKLTLLIDYHVGHGV